MTIQDSNIRIISLLPSATEIIAALGYTHTLVGRSHECNYPHSILSIPTCTSSQINSNASSIDIDRSVKELLSSALSIFNIDQNKLHDLQPSHIITQDQCKVCAISLEQLESELGQLLKNQVKIISLNPKRLGDVWSNIRQIGNALGDMASVEAESYTRKITRRIVEIAMTAGSLNSKGIRVAVIEWINPVIISGNWVPEIINIAGGQNIITSPGQRSKPVSIKQICSADPDIIVFSPCGFTLSRSVKEALEVLKSPLWQTLRAVKNRNCFAIDGIKHFNRPGPRLIESIEVLAEIISPKLFSFSHHKNTWNHLIT